MEKTNNRKTKWIWLSVLLLFVCVAATGAALISRLDGFLLNDEGAISLTDPAGTDNSGENGENQGAGGNSAQNTADNGGAADGQTAADPSVTPPPSNPGFEASDEQTVWSTDTQVEIFRVSYVNGEQVVTVKSDDGEQIIAPGTENSYTFKLKNTGDVALDYTVETDAFFTPADTEIPITARVSRYDGKWMVGGKEEYAQVSALDAAEDHGTLGAGKYTYYTLDWLWPFESGNDGIDTMLGDLAKEQDLIFTIVIKTTATESDNPYDDSGIIPPQTGDNTHFVLWITLSVSSFAMLVWLLFFDNKEKRRCCAEAEKH